MKLSLPFATRRVLALVAVSCLWTTAATNVTDEQQHAENFGEISMIETNRTFFETENDAAQRDLQVFFFQGGDQCRCEASWENLVSCQDVLVKL